MAAFEIDDDAADLEHPAPRAEVIRHPRKMAMLDVQRATMYATMSALLRAGLACDDAAALLHDEYSVRDDRSSAEAVRAFFATVAEVRASKSDTASRMEAVAAAAAANFGSKFIGAEEMALLKSTAVATDVSAVLSACSALLDQYQSQRMAGSHAGFRRVS